MYYPVIRNGLFTRQLSPVIYVKTSVVDNIGPRTFEVSCLIAFYLFLFSGQDIYRKGEDLQNESKVNE